MTVSQVFLDSYSKTDFTKDTKTKGTDFNKTFESISKNENRKNLKTDFKPKDKDLEPKDNIKTEKLEEKPNKDIGKKEEIKTSEKDNISGKEKIEAKDIPKEDLKKLDENIISVLAQALGISIEEIEIILDNLSLEPVDLMDSKNLNLFVQEFFQVESPVELLNIENINEIITDLNSAMDNTFKDFLVEKEIIKPNEKLPENVKEEILEIFNKEKITTDTKVEDISLEDGELVINTNTKEVKTKDNSEKMDLSSNDFSKNNENSGDIETDFTIPVENVIGFNKEVNSQLKAEGIKSIKPMEVVKQIIDEIKVDIKANVSEMKLVLKPESLGEVTLKIASENGIITAQFTAENERVKEIIESNFSQLKDSLNEQGLDISNLTVDIKQGDSDRQMGEFFKGRSESQIRIDNIIKNIRTPEEEMLLREIDESGLYDNNIEYII